MIRLGIAAALLVTGCGSSHVDLSAVGATSPPTRAATDAEVCDAAYPYARAAEEVTRQKGAFEVGDVRGIREIAARLERLAVDAPDPHGRDLATLAETMRNFARAITSNGGEVDTLAFRDALTRLSTWCNAMLPPS